MTSIPRIARAGALERTARDSTSQPADSGHAPGEPGVLRFVLPELAGPYPLAVHSAYDQVAGQSADWVRRYLAFGFADGQGVEDTIACLHPLWAAMCYPTAAPARLLDICNFHQLMFFVDDSDVLLGAHSTATAERVLPRLRALMDGSTAPREPLEEAFVAAWRPIAAQMSPAQRRRFGADIMTYCTGSAEEILARAADRPDDLTEHVRRRRRSTGAYFCLTLMEYGLDVDIADRLAGDPRLNRMRDLLADQVGLVNDILSYRKEHFTGDTVNALHILQSTQALTLQQAVDATTAMITGIDARFAAERDRLLASPLGRDPDVVAYLAGMEHMIAGNTRWHFHTPRYNGAGHRWNGVTHGAVTWYPDRTVYGDEAPGEGAAIEGAQP